MTHSSKDIIYKEMSFSECYEELMPMLQKQWETSGDLIIKELKVDVAQYLYLENIGLHKSIVAMDGDKIVGYISLLVSHHLHHRGVKIATTCCFYIDENYRKNKVGLNLIKFTENHMKEKYGMEYLQLITNKNAPMKDYMERLGYGLSDYLFIKEL